MKTNTQNAQFTQKVTINPVAAMLYGLDAGSCYRVTAQEKVGRAMYCTLEDTRDGALAACQVNRKHLHPVD